MKNIIALSITVLTATSGLVFGKIETASALTWNWSYSVTGVDASGTLTTNDTPDDLGFYQITGITGTRNNETITGLEATGTSIPGNEPFELDNLISLNPEQLTSDGFGYSTSGGNFVNVFFASFLEPPGYFEIFSAPPFVPGFENFGPEDSELPGTFTAAPISVPEPISTLSLFALGTFGVGSAILGKKKQKL
ncbi:MAG: PEP-CTERM sorting domain-containing protein [Symploca sp. SIO2C1]|nr:PEP-CTERM sorting domain-containing protein [Symploca sp. SIO2C1]